MKILMRAQMDHTKLFTPEEVYLGNLMGGNSGNWLYQFSLFRALMTDESVKIDTIDTKTSLGTDFFSSKYANHLNKNYDCFVLPLANAFRNTFVDELKELAEAAAPAVPIGQAAAKSIALDHAGISDYEAYDIDVELDDEKGALIYEVEFKADGMEYDYEIDAVSGSILRCESELDD